MLGLPTNEATKTFTGLKNTILRRTHLLHSSLRHDHDLVAKGHGFFLIVRYIDCRRLVSW